LSITAVNGSIGVQQPANTTPPAVAITAPASGATVSGNLVTVMATATAAGSDTISNVKF
jgi:hypothetical protein